MEKEFRVNLPNGKTLIARDRNDSCYPGIDVCITDTCLTSGTTEDLICVAEHSPTGLSGPGVYVRAYISDNRGFGAEDEPAYNELYEADAVTSLCDNTNEGDEVNGN